MFLYFKRIDLHYWWNARAPHTIGGISRFSKPRWFDFAVVFSCFVSPELRTSEKSAKRLEMVSNTSSLIASGRKSRTWQGNPIKSITIDQKQSERHWKSRYTTLQQLLNVATSRNRKARNASSRNFVLLIYHVTATRDWWRKNSPGNCRVKAHYVNKEISGTASREVRCLIEED